MAGRTTCTVFQLDSAWGTHRSYGVILCSLEPRYCYHRTSTRETHEHMCSASAERRYCVTTVPVWWHSELQKGGG